MALREIAVASWRTHTLPRWAVAWVLLAAPLAFVALFLVYPLEGIVQQSFFGENGSLAGLKPLVEDTYFLERAWFSLWEAAVSTVLTLLVALPCAWAIARHEFRGKSLLVAIITVPFVMPTIVVAVAFTALLGPQGAVNSVLRGLPGVGGTPVDLMNTIWIILLAHVFYNFGVVARIVAASWSGIDSRVDDAAAMLGAGPVRRFVTVTLPLLRTPILAAASLVFLFCFTSFGVILVLGGPQYNTVETEIYRETIFQFRLPVAAALAICQLVFTFVVMWAYTWLQQGAASGGIHDAPRRSPPARERWLTGLVAMAMALIVLLPVGALVERSFHAAGGYTLEYYRLLGQNLQNQAIFVEPLPAIGHSVGFAALTVLFAVPLGTLAAYGSVRAGRRSHWVESAVLLPLGASAVTLALGFIVTFDKAPLNLRGTWWLLVIAYTLVAFPFVMRTVLAQLRGMDEHVREAARMLGAGPLRVFLEVDLPLTWRSMAAGAVFAFAIAMGEFGATLLLTRPEWATMPVAIYRLLGRPGDVNYGQSLAMSSILMGVTVVAFVLIDRLRVRNAGVF